MTRELWWVISGLRGAFWTLPDFGGRLVRRMPLAASPHTGKVCEAISGSGHAAGHLAAGRLLSVGETGRQPAVRSSAPGGDAVEPLPQPFELDPVDAGQAVRESMADEPADLRFIGSLLSWFQ